MGGGSCDWPQQGLARLVVTEEAAVRGEALRRQLAEGGVELVTAQGQGQQAGGGSRERPEFSLAEMLPLILEGRGAEETAAAQTLLQLAS